jgi:predicted aspartyl protease
MPDLTLPLDYAGRPMIALYVGTAAAEAGLFHTEEPAPPDVRALALVDTGAERTVVERALLDALGLAPVGVTRFHSATTGPEPVTAAVYAVRVALAEETTGVLAADLAVVAAESLGALGVRVLLVCRLWYDGPGRVFRLTFEPERPSG